MSKHHKKSLEQELLNAKLSIDETNELCVIDRFASRKRDRITNTNTNTNTTSSEKLHKKSYLKENDDSSNEANFWKEKYENLSIEKIQGDEDQDKLINNMQEKEKKLELYIKLLEKKNLLLKQGGNNISDSTEIDDNVNDIYEAKLNKIKILLKFYEDINGMTVKLEENEKYNNYICTVKNKEKRIATRFTISQPLNDENDLKYSPNASVDILPEYLQCELKFEKELLPILLNDVLQSLYSEDEK